MKLYEEPIQLRRVTNRIQWVKSPKEATVHGILLWVQHCEGILRSINGISLQDDQQTLLEYLVRVIQDLDVTVFSTLERKLWELSGSDAIYYQQRKNLSEATKKLRETMKDVPLFKSTGNPPTRKRIPNLSPLELRVKLLYKQNGFASLEDLREAIKQLHLAYLQLPSNNSLPRAKKTGVPAVLFLSELQLPQTESLCAVGCTAEACPQDNSQVGLQVEKDMEELQTIYWQRRSERLSTSEKESIEKAHDYFRKAIKRWDRDSHARASTNGTLSRKAEKVVKIEAMIQQFDIFQTSFATAKVHRCALSTRDMKDRNRCHGCHVLNRFKMPHEQPLSESIESGGLYHPLSCAESLVMALVKRYLSGSGNS